MRAPANPPGVVFGLLLTGFVAVMGFVIGLDGSTRRGVPVWLLSVVGVACGLRLVVQFWREPRPPADSSLRLRRSVRAGLGGAAIYAAIAIVAAVISLVVLTIR